MPQRHESDNPLADIDDRPSPIVCEQHRCSRFGRLLEARDQAIDEHPADALEVAGRRLDLKEVVNRLDNVVEQPLTDTSKEVGNRL
jgi:hypothetical protein